MNEGWVKGIAITVVGTVLAAVLLIWLGFQPTETTDFVVKSRLGMGQFAEETTITVDGKAVGTLRTDSGTTTDQRSVSVSGSGRYPYTISSNVMLQDGRQVSGTGQGTIEVTDGKVFEVLIEPSGGNTARLSLKE